MKQKWWRDYDQECAAWTGTPPAEDFRLISARSEAGLHIRLRLYTTQPMYYGTFKV